MQTTQALTEENTKIPENRNGKKNNCINISRNKNRTLSQEELNVAKKSKPQEKNLISSDSNT